MNGIRDLQRTGGHAVKRNTLITSMLIPTDDDTLTEGSYNSIFIS